MKAVSSAGWRATRWVFQLVGHWAAWMAAWMAVSTAGLMAAQKAAPKVLYSVEWMADCLAGDSAYRLVC